LLLARGESCSPDQLARLERLVSEDPADYIYTHYLPILHHCAVSTGFADRYRGIVSGVYRKNLVSYSLLVRETACILEAFSVSLGLEPILLEGVALADGYYPSPPVRWTSDNTMLASALPAKIPDALFDSLPAYRLIHDNFECCVLRSPSGLVHLMWRCLPDGLLPGVATQSRNTRSDSGSSGRHGFPVAIPELQLLLALRRVGAADSQYCLERALLDVCYMLSEPGLFQPLLIESCLRSLKNRFSISRGLEILSAHVKLDESDRELLEVIYQLLPEISLPPCGKEFSERLKEALWRRPRRLVSHPQFSLHQYFRDMFGRQISRLFL
jgi:hypothetical protein